MDILVESWYSGLLARWRSPYPVFKPTRIEAAVMEFIEEMAKPKRPPLKWDNCNQKALPYPWGLYFKGKRYDNIIRYDVEENQFWYKTASGLNQHIVGSFIVKRLG